MNLIKKRNYQLDLIRVIACLMVVIMHSPLPTDKSNTIFLNILNYSTAPCIGLFFMVSGALLLPIKEGTASFLKRRLSKILAPTLFWSLIYIGYNHYQGTNHAWWKDILSLPFSAQGHGVMWFMYTLTGLYLIAPILSKWLDACSKRELEFYLVLWAITLCYPLLRLFLFIQIGETGILYYCTGYVGYFLWGYYLIKYPESISWRVLIPAVLIALFVPVFCKWKQYKVDFYSLFWYLSIFVAICCTVWFKGLIQFGKPIIGEEKIKVVITQISNLSFGIYLMHIFVMRYIVWKWTWIQNISNYIGQTILIVILTLSLSILGCYLLSKLPGAAYMIGYKQKNNKCKQSKNSY